MTDFKRAWDNWLASDEGQRAADTDTLHSDRIGSKTYQENRLWRAFQAGYEAAQSKENTSNE